MKIFFVALLIVFIFPCSNVRRPDGIKKEIASETLRRFPFIDSSACCDSLRVVSDELAEVKKRNVRLTWRLVATWAAIVSLGTFIIFRRLKK